VDNVVLDDAVENVASDEAKFTVNGRQRALCVRPLIGLVVSGVGVGVVEIRNRDLSKISFYFQKITNRTRDLPIQWFIQR
jgi:hypothetical protein